MEINILHLSDLHFEKEFDFADKLDSLSRVAINEFVSIENLFIVVSGDIANSGKSEEYDIAHIFFDGLRSKINETIAGINIEYILVPGNHDCDFNIDNQLRKNSIKCMNYQTIGGDNSVVDTCLSIQKNFWDFYRKYSVLPDDKLSFSIVHSVGDKKIKFNCHNTAWMSQVDEKPATLFFPAKRYNVNVCEDGSEINISVLHHPVTWFTPNTEVNNRREFQKYLDDVSSLHIIGHEHEFAIEKRQDLDTDGSSVNFYGAILRDIKNKNASGFQVIKLDTLSKSGNVRKYAWDSNMFVEILERGFAFNGIANRSFCLNEKFAKEINSIRIPLAGKGNDDRLSDIFVYPDLEELGGQQKRFDDQIDSKVIIANTIINNCVLEGESQVGKTSLLQMIFLEYYDRGKYPIIIDGSEIINSDIDRIIKKAFLKLYSVNNSDYDKYRQLDRDKKVLLIDNYHKIKLDSKVSQKFTVKAAVLQGQIIITIDTLHSMIPNIHADLSGFKSYKIIPFGYKKTNDIIVKYHCLKDKQWSGQRQLLLAKTRHTFDQVRNILGDKILPSYPVFILSILQSLENASIDLKETSYGYCYQSLIHLALVGKAGVDNEDIGSYVNFIKELSFYFHTNDIVAIKDADLQAFYTEYSRRFVIAPFETIKSKLLDSKILKYDEGYYEYAYIYILYFLIAKHLSEIINKQEGKEVLSKLFEGLHLEKNANILVFVTHHTKDISFIHDSLFSAMVPFENVEPITLQIGGKFYQNLTDISGEISHNIIEQNRVPEEERERSLLAQDKADKIKKIHESQDGIVENELNEAMFPFLQAFRSIEIVGQIVKNRRGSLEKNELVDLIVEIYLTGFRTVGFVGTTFSDAKDELTEELRKKIKSSDDRAAIERKINLFFKIIGMQTCYDIFSKIIFSAGLKDFQELYNEVACRIGTPAAKLVSFSINSYYNELSIKEVASLAREFEGNYVALHILKSRVKSYIYNNHVSYSKQQRIAQILGMNIKLK